MEFSSFGVSVIARDSIAALQAGTGISGTALLTIVAVSLLYPIADVVNLAKARGAREGHSLPAGPAICDHSQNLQFACPGGHAAVAADVRLWRRCGRCDRNTGRSRSVTDIHSSADLRRKVSLPALPYLSWLVGILTMALSAASSMLSASLWVLRYDLLPALWPMLSPEQTRPAEEAIARRRTILVGCGFCVGAILLVVVADALFGMSFTPSTFFAVLFACFCAQLSFISLMLASLGLTGRYMGAVSAPWALLIIGVAAASGIAAVIVYSGNWSRAMAVGRGSCLSGIRTCALRRRSALPRGSRRRMR